MSVMFRQFLFDVDLSCGVDIKEFARDNAIYF